MKEWIGIIAMFLGLILVMVGVAYGAWLIHPVLGVIVIGCWTIAIGRSMLDR